MENLKSLLKLKKIDVAVLGVIAGVILAVYELSEGSIKLASLFAVLFALYLAYFRFFKQEVKQSSLGKDILRSLLSAVIIPVFAFGVILLAAALYLAFVIVE